MPTLSANQIAGYAKNAGVSGQNIAIATAIALAESGGNPQATSPVNSNGTVDKGLWQINSVHTALISGHDVYDPAQNAAMMFSLSNGGTKWTAWSTYKNGAYLRYMAQASGASPDTTVGPASSNVQNASLSADLSAIQNFARLISDPHTWLRLGMIVGGGIMLYVAVRKTVDLPSLPTPKHIAHKIVTGKKPETGTP